MFEPPHKLDGATVITVAKTDTRYNLGVASDQDSQTEISIKAGAICRYDKDVGIYLFACDKEWNVIGDLLFDSVEEAMKEAEVFYNVNPIGWVKLNI